MATSIEDIPKQVRVRTDPDEGYGHRHDAIVGAADRFDCNKSDAIVYACDAAGQFLENVERALLHEELSPRVARELAEAMSTRYLEVVVEERSVRVETK